MPSRTVITERDVPHSGELHVPHNALITPSARDLLRERGIKLIELAKGAEPPPPAATRTIAIGADHGGFRLKQELKPVIAEMGYSIEDLGIHDGNPADYPDIAAQVAERVASGRAARGVMIDGAGIGSAMVCNKVPGVRAALCYDKASARNSREHNDSNVLTLGGRLQTSTQAEDVLRVWLSTPFAGGRHQARVDKITEAERRYRSWTPPNSNNS